MKNIYLLMLSLLCILSIQGKTTTINGKINGKLPETFYYTTPVNGTLPFYLNQTAEVKPDGSFTITANIDDVTFIDLFYNYQSAGSIVAQPGKQYRITITEKEDKINTIITGDDTALQELYNSMVDNHRMTLIVNLATEYAKITSAEALKTSINKRCETDKTVFNSLAKKGGVPQNVLAMLYADRDYFYAAVEGYTIVIKHMVAEREPNAPDLKPFDLLWESIYKKYNPKNTVLTKTPCGVFFLDMYKNYEKYKRVNFDGKKIPILEDELGNAKLSAEIIPAKTLEYYLASQIFGSLFDGKKDKTLIETYAFFKKMYPSSVYIQELEPRMEIFEAFYASNNTIPINSAFINDYEKVNTIGELAAKFPGKKLYIDIWATWCKPCREEFKYKDELYKLLKQYNYTIVYISIDKESKDELWKKTISYYGLQGHHIRANESLDKDIRLLYSNSMSISIPWYLLIDKNGKLAKKGAAGASNKEELKKQLKELQ